MLTHRVPPVPEASCLPSLSHLGHPSQTVGPALVPCPRCPFPLSSSSALRCGGGVGGLGGGVWGVVLECLQPDTPSAKSVCHCHKQEVRGGGGERKRGGREEGCLGGFDS